MTTHETANNQDPSLYCTYVGGPRDGLKTGDLPAQLSGKNLTGMTSKMPLSQPHQYSLYAVYVCTSETQVDGFWVFEYQGMEGPNGEKLVAADAEKPLAPAEPEVVSTPNAWAPKPVRVCVDYSLLLEKHLGLPRWASGEPDAIMPGVQWTIHIDGEAQTQTALLELARMSGGYFFCGGRVLVDRFYDGADCDIYITGLDTRTRVREDLTDIIRLGSAPFAEWDDVAIMLFERVHS